MIQKEVYLVLVLLQLEAETSYEEALKDLDKERHGTVKDLLAAKLSDGIKIVINEMVDLKMHELFKATNKKLETTETDLKTSENKRKQVEADLDTANQNAAKRRKGIWNALKRAHEKSNLDDRLEEYLELEDDSAIADVKELFKTPDIDSSYQAVKDAVEAILRNNSDLAKHYGYNTPQNLDH